MDTGILNAWDNPVMDYHPIKRGVEILYPWSRVTLKPEISTSLMGHQA